MVGVLCGRCGWVVVVVWGCETVCCSKHKQSVGPVGGRTSLVHGLNLAHVQSLRRRIHRETWRGGDTDAGMVRVRLLRATTRGGTDCVCSRHIFCGLYSSFENVHLISSDTFTFQSFIISIYCDKPQFKMDKTKYHDLARTSEGCFYR